MAKKSLALAGFVFLPADEDDQQGETSRTKNISSSGMFVDRLNLEGGKAHHLIKNNRIVRRART